MSQRVKTYLAGTFLLLMVLLLGLFKLTQPRILVLHSYNTDYSWTRDIDVAIHRRLDSRLRYKVHWHYMDLKNHPEREFKRRAAAIARRAVDSIRPDVIIAVDDDAQELVAKEFVNRPGVSIIYAGINGSIEPYGYHRANNAAGILERKSMRDLRDALSSMRREGKPLGARLLHLGDSSESVRMDAQEIEAFEWGPLKLVGSERVPTFEDWQREVKAAAGRSDVILVSNYRSLKRSAAPNAPLVPAEEVVRWTEQNSAVPLVGITGSYVEEGGMFAIGASGFEQGEVVARMAIRLLEGEAVAGDLGTQQPRQFIVYMRRSAMEKRQVALPRLYESFARGTNNYYE